MWALQISIGIAGPSAPPNAKPLFNEFIRKLKSMMDGTGHGLNEYSRLEAMRLGMRGCGIFSGAIVSFMGEPALKVQRALVFFLTTALHLGYSSTQLQFT